MPARNPDQEKEVLQVAYLKFILIRFQGLIFFKWVEAVMGEPLPSGDFGEILKDGVVLCKLMNKLQPGSIKKFKEKVDMFGNPQTVSHPKSPT